MHSFITGIVQVIVGRNVRVFPFVLCFTMQISHRYESVVLMYFCLSVAFFVQLFVRREALECRTNRANPY